MADLGKLPGVGILNPANPVTPGAWTVTFPSQDLPNENFEVWHGYARGPGGYAEVWIDDAGFGILQSGRVNEYAPAGSAMFVRKGSTIFVHWSITTAPAPKVIFYFRQPEVGRL